MLEPGWVEKLNREVLAWEQEFLRERERLIAAGEFPDVPNRKRPKEDE